MIQATLITTQFRKRTEKINNNNNMSASNIEILNWESTREWDCQQLKKNHIRCFILFRIKMCTLYIFVYECVFHVFHLTVICRIIFDLAFNLHIYTVNTHRSGRNHWKTCAHVHMIINEHAMFMLDERKPL